MATWAIWLIIAVLLGVAEIFTLTAALGLLGGAALLTAGSAAIGLPVPVQLLVFAVSAVSGIVILRPVVARRMLSPGLQRFGVDALVGQTAVVLHDVSPRGGTVRLGGEEWSARALDETVEIPAGTQVDVIRIDGATALVYPRE